jgi:hypothetical protein
MQVKREVIITLSKRRNGQPPVKYKIHESGAVTTTGRNPEPLGRVLTGLLLSYGAISQDEYEATEKMYKRWHFGKADAASLEPWVHNPSEVPAWG